MQERPQDKEGEVGAGKASGHRAALRKCQPGRWGGGAWEQRLLTEVPEVPCQAGMAQIWCPCCTVVGRRTAWAEYGRRYGRWGAVSSSLQPLWIVGPDSTFQCRHTDSPFAGLGLGLVVKP